MSNEFKVGDVLYSSWGYDQTNIDFYQIVGVLPKSIKIRKIGQRSIKTDRGCEYVVPVTNTFSSNKIMTKRITKYNGVSINSYSFAYLWEGKPCYQTAAGYGH